MFDLDLQFKKNKHLIKTQLPLLMLVFEWKQFLLPFSTEC